MCDRLGADIDDLARGMGLDNRIGRKFLHVSPGYGGSCFPKDTSALSSIAKSVDFDLKIVNAATEVNDRQKLMMVDKIEKTMGDVNGKIIGILGLAFKPNTDDMRESASITICAGLTKKGAKIQAFDPVAMEEAKKEIPDIKYCKDAYEVAKDADAIVILTEWNEFRHLDLGKVKELFKGSVFIDLRNIYEPEKMHRFGFKYSSLGRA